VQVDLGPRVEYHGAMDLAILLLVILILVLMWRGPKTLPKLGQAAGRGIKALRDEASAKISEEPGDKS
jgi:Sec-independent protein translocase protein TatA